MIRAITCAMVFSLCGAAVVMPQNAKTNGAKIFTDEKCVLCHSIAGKGNTKGPLDEVGSKLSTAEIREWITDAKTMTAKTKAERKPEMKAYTLAKDEVDALVAYLSTMKKK